MEGSGGGGGREGGVFVVDRLNTFLRHAVYDKETPSKEAAHRLLCLFVLFPCIPSWTPETLICLVFVFGLWLWLTFFPFLSVPNPMFFAGVHHASRDVVSVVSSRVVPCCAALLSGLSLPRADGVRRVRPEHRR